jgi:hypothetical protein
MAEETMTIETNTEVTENTPTVEELMAQLAQANAERDRFKSANDKLSKSEAEMKRQLRARQSAEEQEAEALAEAQRIADEERESMRKELNHIKAVNAYKNVSEKSVEKLIDAVSDADHNAIAQIIEAEVKQAVRLAEAEWLKSRPQIGGGSYTGMTKEQILAISDREERLKAIAMSGLFK